MNKSSHYGKRAAEQKALRTLMPLLLPSFEEVISKGVKEHLDEMKRVVLESTCGGCDRVRIQSRDLNCFVFPADPQANLWSHYPR